MTQNPPILKLREPIPSEPNLPDGFKPITIEHAAGLLSRWTFERKAYPGWVVAPEDKRFALWWSTSKWLRNSRWDVQDWNKVDRILVFRELNWRLDVSMVPLLANVISQFRQAVSDLFEDLLQVRDLKASPELAGGKHFDSTDILHAWLEVAFGLLREARESYNAEYWSELDEKIQKLIAREEQYKDRYQYERILWAMWNVQKERAKQLLSEWQPSSAKPVATIWKAGLLAELNELSEARDLLRNTLREIRSSERLLGRNIHLFSLEGWCTYLIVAVELALDVHNGTIVRREFQERWQELKTWDCDPWTIQSALEASLSKPAPEVKGKIKKTQQFDVGRVVVSHNLFSDRVHEYLPAFAYIRFFEQVGIPMRLNILNIAGDELRAACSWIAPFAEFWSPALLIRAGKLDSLTKDDSFLGRTQVALMDKTLVDRIFDWCLQIWDRETVNLAGTREAMFEKDSLLSCLAEVLSRLALRLDDEQLEQSFLRAFAIYPLTGHQGYQLCSAAKHWFFRLYEKAEPKLLLQWLPKLIKAPLVQNLTLPEEKWVDALEEFPSRRIEKAEMDSFTESELQKAVEWLIKRAESESGAARSRALLRLMHVYHGGKLAPNQVVDFSDLLWSERDDKNLPALNWLQPSAFTRLPAPSNIDVAAILKSNILQMQVFQGGFIREDGAMVFGPEPLPDLIYQSAQNTKPPIEILGESGILTWTTAEAHLLNERAMQWWSHAKQKISEPNPFGSIDKSRIGLILARFIAYIVCPAIDVQNTTAWNKLTDWIADLRAHEIYVTSALPYVMWKSQKTFENFYEQWLGDLSGNEEHAVAAAANAVRHLVAVQNAEQSPQPAYDLVAILVERVAFRRKPALHSCISRLTQLIAQFPNSISPPELTILVTSLGPWFEVLPLESQTQSEISEGEKPTLRYLICALAGTLSALYEFKQLPPSDAIAIWHRASEIDPLPEVQRAFDEGRVLFFNATNPEKG